MNHLAHLVLAGPQEGLRLGAFLGDHIKGRLALERLPADWADGVRLHRRIDSLSDQHPVVRDLSRRFPPHWRRYGPVVLDVLFDHMLTRYWTRFGPEPLARLAVDVDALLARHAGELPERLNRFAAWARAEALWQRYGERAMLDRIFSGLARRHKRISPLASGLEILDAWEAEIEAGFLEMFPDLLEQTRSWRSNAP